MVQNDIINDYIAGAIGGAAGLVVGHPFDTTKVQLQTRQTSTPFKNSWEAIRSISRSGLRKGFFRGLAFPLASYGVVNSVFFGVYGNTLRLIKGEHTAREATHLEIFLAGCSGGFFQLFVACPVDVVKVVLQSQIRTIGGGSTSGLVQTTYFRGPVHCVRWLYAKHGVRGLYHGFGAMLLRDVPTYGLYTLTYEALFVRIRSGSSAPDAASDVAAGLLAGGVAGVAAWTCALPMDVVKSVLQADVDHSTYRHLWHCVRHVYGARGPRGFFAGWTVCALRAFPTNAVTFVFYEQSLRMLRADGH